MGNVALFLLGGGEQGEQGELEEGHEQDGEQGDGHGIAIAVRGRHILCGR